MNPSEPTLDALIAARLRASGLTVATAESATGGLIAKRLTDQPGSSAYVKGGVVVYSDEVKQRVLGVPAEVLAAHGAVSEAVARAMAGRARALFAADLALSVTGIAGPAGGTPEQPVGLHFIGLSAADGTWVRRHAWAGTRSENREAAAGAALALLLAYLDGAL